MIITTGLRLHLPGPGIWPIVLGHLESFLNGAVQTRQLFLSSSCLILK